MTGAIAKGTAAIDTGDHIAVTEPSPIKKAPRAGQWRAIARWADRPPQERSDEDARSCPACA